MNAHIQSTLELFLSEQVIVIEDGKFIPSQIHHLIPSTWLGALSEDTPLSRNLAKIWATIDGSIHPARECLFEITQNIGLVVSSASQHPIGLLYLCQHSNQTDLFTWLGMPPVTAHDINLWEKQAGVQLPPTYTNLLKIHNGFWLDGWSSVGPKSLSQLYWIEYHADQTDPPRLLAFSGDGGGNEQCFHYQNNSPTSNLLTVDWDHETREGSRVKPFGQYLQNLFETARGA
ncbi:MAG: SMI1/KNR4 family protein [Chloroflexota bacterium]